MSNQYLSFDVTKQSAPQQLITGRQGDSQLKFVTMLLWDGDKNIPYDLTGKQVVFEALKPDNTHIVDYEGITILDATAGLVRYSFNEQVFSVAGTMQQSFFKITHTDSDNNVISDSTLEVAISILENRVEFGINSEDYLSEYDDLIVEVKKKFDDYASTVQDSITKAQALHDQIVEYTNLINSGAVILKKDFGEISNIKQPVGSSFIEKLNNEFENRGVNIQWFGTKGNGIDDDTDAFLRGIEYVKSHNQYLYVPNGTYNISKPLNLKNNYLIGETKYGTILKIKCNTGIYVDESVVRDIQIDMTESENGSRGFFIGYEDKYGFKGGSFSTINNVIIKSSYNLPETIGIYMNPYNSSSSVGIFNNKINNITFNEIGYGINLASGENGWINGNSFKNIVINGFYNRGIILTSTDQKSLVSQRNIFENINIMSVSTRPAIGAIALDISHGQNNIFKNITDWNDTGSRDDIIGLNIGLSASSQSFLDIFNNTIEDCKFEHQISADDAQLNLQNGYLTIMNYIKSYYVGGVNKYFERKTLGKINNIIPNNIIYSEYVNPNKNNISISALRGTGVVKNGPYLSLKSGSDFSYSFDKIQVNMFYLTKWATASIKLSTNSPLNLDLNSKFIILKGNDQELIEPVKIFANKISQTEYVINFMFHFDSSKLIDPTAEIKFDSFFNSKNSDDFFNISDFKIGNFPLTSIDNYK